MTTSTAMSPIVADLSHHNTVTSFPAAYRSGLRGIIHKATQGTYYTDPDYAPRRAAARAAGLLWGAYHFATGEDVAVQVAYFLKVALQGDPNADSVLLALDWEPNPNKGGQMSLSQAKQFLELVAERTGQKAVVYSGHTIKEAVGANGWAKGDAFLSSHRLWLAQYASKPVLPAGFARYFLWQYTGDKCGPLPHGVDGIMADANERDGLDLNVYDGTEAELAAEWAPAAGASAGVEVAAAPASPVPAVPKAQPATPRDIQAALAAKGFDPGPVDGVLGAKSLSAMMAAIKAIPNRS